MNGWLRKFNLTLELMAFSLKKYSLNLKHKGLPFYKKNKT
jgi:hypothetical protein